MEELPENLDVVIEDWRRVEAEGEKVAWMNIPTERFIGVWYEDEVESWMFGGENTAYEMESKEAAIKKAVKFMQNNRSINDMM